MLTCGWRACGAVGVPAKWWPVIVKYRPSSYISRPAPVTFDHSLPGFFPRTNVLTPVSLGETSVYESNSATMRAASGVSTPSGPRT